MVIRLVWDRSLINYRYNRSCVSSYTSLKKLKQGLNLGLRPVHNKQTNWESSEHVKSNFQSWSQQEQQTQHRLRCSNVCETASTQSQQEHIQKLGSHFNTVFILTLYCPCSCASKQQSLHFNTKGVLFFSSPVCLMEKVEPDWGRYWRTGTHHTHSRILNMRGTRARTGALNI